MSCGPLAAGSTAQSSPMPNGARGEASPSQRRMATISFSSPSAATESAVFRANGELEDFLATTGVKEIGEVGGRYHAVTPEKMRTMVFKLNSPCATIVVAMRPVRA